MDITKVKIFNITLNILGISTPIENVNLNDNKAIILNNYYELARDYVLKDFDWNFASCFKTLSLKNIENQIGNFSYCYNYPNDCICARDIFEKGSYRLEKFEIAALEDGTSVILTNAKNAVLRYTKRVEKEIFFNVEFSMALAYYLATITSNVLVGNLQKGESAHQKYVKILSRAKVLNAQEGADILYDEETYLSSRS